MSEVYDNTPTVVVALVPIETGGLLMIRRALPDGKGELALPGGYQVRPDSLQQTAAREVLEETGAVIDPAMLRLIDAETVPNGAVNLVFYESPPIPMPDTAAHDREVEEVVVIAGPVETAFSIHTRMVEHFFARRSK